MTLVVGVILAGALLMPVINDTTATERTFKNLGYYSLDVAKADPADTITIEFDHTKPLVLTVNGEEISMPKQIVTFVGSNDIMVRYFYNNDTRVSVHAYIGSTNNGVYADSWNDQDMTITISEGTVTASNGSTTRQSTPTSDIYCISAESGEYVMKPYDQTAKLKGDSKFIAIGRTAVNSSNVCLYAEGTITEGVPNIDVFYKSAETTTANVEINATPVTGYVNLYTFDNFTFDLTQGEDTVVATYSAIIIPAEVTAELSQHLNNGEIALINTIPVMVIVALLMVAIGAIALRRAD